MLSLNPPEFAGDSRFRGLSDGQKTEVIRRRGPWLRLDAVELATLEWVEWLNHRPLFEPIGKSWIP